MVIRGRNFGGFLWTRSWGANVNPAPADRLYDSFNFPRERGEWTMNYELPICCCWVSLIGSAIRVGPTDKGDHWMTTGWLWAWELGYLKISIEKLRNLPKIWSNKGVILHYCVKFKKLRNYTELLGSVLMRKVEELLEHMHWKSLSPTSLWLNNSCCSRTNAIRMQILLLLLDNRINSWQFHNFWQTTSNKIEWTCCELGNIETGTILRMQSHKCIQF